MNDALDIATNAADPLQQHLVNGNGLQLNGHLDSPTTPVNDNPLASSMKMSMDIQEPESDVRHEPLPVKLDKLDHASIAPEVGTPLDPGPCLFYLLSRSPSLLTPMPPASIAISPPNGTPPPAVGQLLEDVKMAESAPTPSSDFTMTELAAPNGRENTKRSREPTPVASVPSLESIGASTSLTSPANEHSTPEDEGSVPPPAKRARTFSDADQASMIVSAFHIFRTPLLAC